ncbi:DNA-binding transcriptional LysR family regulator [Brevibacterium sanguinis]|uniref:DNA-binding transcriptional LysR family regulator n=2 Tax=Brevibacterium TaxID=1696 RepID=A0A366IKI7_9MICO|nr:MULTISPECIES: LysR family transcriptional regulator [Brevibacterium]RBP65005.1 DNA-binding transcriptional LysR family regulator [Brevibacterium sanguinis]RBP71268.1 DNA-binding transcriptional LysR family regulator [Brevibacterium celere]
MTELQPLGTLLAVIDFGSIHLAAKSLYVSHSTASRQVRALEEHYGTPLLDRSSTGVVPTQAGLAVADFARRMIGESELLVDSFGGRFAQVEQLHIVTTTALGQTIVADAVHEVLAATDRLRITVSYADSLEALRILQRRRADVCVNFSVSGTDLVDVPGVATNVRVATRSLALLDSAHPLAERDHVSIRDIAEFPLATLPAGNTVRLQIETAMRRQGQVLSPALECSCPVIMAKAVTGTTMIAMMSERTLPGAFAAEAGCRAIPIVDENLDHRWIQVLTRSPQASSEGVDLLLGALRAQL